jgi:tetratricopeptide (TPR) repeat protein
MLDPSPGTAPSASRGGAAPIAIALGLAALVAAVFAPVRHFGSVNFDDPTYVFRNSHVLSGLTLDGVIWAFTAFHAGNWHPLTWLTHMADVSLFGADAGSHHLVNVLLHAVNSALLFAVLRRATGATWRSALAAALFAVHPLHVESVAWISERKDVLSTLFWLATLLAWIDYVRRPSGRRYALALLLFALGLLSKPMIVSLPVVLVLLDVWPLERLSWGELFSRKAVPLLREKLPFVALSAASCVVTVAAQASAGAVGGVRTFPFGARVANAALAYVGYLAKAVWPVDLVAAYPHAALRGMPWASAAAAALLLAAITAVAVWQRRRRPWLAVGWLWYLVTLLPVIGLVQVGWQGMADRYTYVPLIGIFWAIAWGLGELAGASEARRVALAIACCSIVVALAALARRQVGTWSDSFALYEHALSLDPENPLALRGLGAAYVDGGMPAQAIAPLGEAAKRLPEDAQTWTNLGIAYATVGRAPEAEASFERALRMTPRDPYVWFNAGIAAALRGDWPAAAAAEQQLQELSPEMAARLGRVLSQGRR